MSAPALRVRPAREADLEALLSLVRALALAEGLAESFSATCEDYRRQLFGPHPAAEVLVGEQDGRVVACAVFQMRFSTFLGRPMLYLEDLVVAEEARGQGVGRRMLAQVAALAVARGAARLDWSVLEWNASALRLYRRVGAVELGDWRCYRLAGEALRALAAEAD